MSERASEYKKGPMSNADRKARLKQRCMDDVASKRAKIIRSLRNAPDSVAVVGHAIVESMQSEDPGVDPDDPHAGLTEAEYQEIMASLEDALVVWALYSDCLLLCIVRGSFGYGLTCYNPLGLIGCFARRGWSRRKSA